jgi:hypothetical protein
VYWTSWAFSAYGKVFFFAALFVILWAVKAVSGPIATIMQWTRGFLTAALCRSKLEGLYERSLSVSVS